jgi:hypothetical protein
VGAEVFLGRDPLTGRKRYATRTVRGGKREAQTALAGMVTEAERGLTVRTTATVGELLEAWFEFAAPDFSPKTVKETRGYIDRSLMPALGSRRLAKLKPSIGVVDARSVAPRSTRTERPWLRRHRPAVVGCVRLPERDRRRRQAPLRTSRVLPRLGAERGTPARGRRRTATYAGRPPLPGTVMVGV